MNSNVLIVIANTGFTICRLIDDIFSITSDGGLHYTRPQAKVSAVYLLEKISTISRSIKNIFFKLLKNQVFRHISFLKLIKQKY